MRFLIVADVHLGFRSLNKTERGVNVRERDVYESFFRVLEVVTRESPDVVFIAGDLFDSRRPSADAYNVAFEVISRFPETVIVAGNHDNDSPYSRSPLRVLQRRLSNVRVVLRPQVLSVKGYRVFCLPYAETCGFEPADFLVAHVRDSRISRYRGSLRVRNELYRFCFSGDLHVYTKVDENFVYVGAPERFTFEQEGHPVGVLLFEPESLSLQYVEFPGRKFVTLETPPSDLEELRGAVVRVVLDEGVDTSWLRQIKDVALYVSVTWRRTRKEDVVPVEITKGNLFEKFEAFVARGSFSSKAVELSRTALRSAHEFEQSKSF